MRAFAYNAFTASGKRRKGTIVAESEIMAAKALRDQGLFAEEISAKTTAPRKWAIGSLFRPKVTDSMRAVFVRQMAVLLSSGISAEQALETVHSAGGMPAIEAAAAHATAALMDGAPLSEALARSGAGFPPFILSSIRAGETAGELPIVFETLADYLEEAGTDKAALSTALIYPAFVASVALLVCGVLMINVAPEIVAMFETSGRPLPPLTRVVLAITGWIETYWTMLAGGFASLCLAIVVLGRRPFWRDRWHGLVLRMPLFGRYARMSEAAQYLRTLALVIASRHPVVDAVENAAQVLRIQKFRDEAKATRIDVEAGQSMSEAMQKMTLIPPVCCQLIRAGEQSARLARMTERAAVLVETWVSNDRKRMIALLDPLLMIVVGVLVLVIVLAVLLPIFDLQAVVTS